MARTPKEMLDEAGSFRSIFDRSPTPMWMSDWSGVERELLEHSVSTQADFETALGSDPDLAMRAWARVKTVLANAAALSFFGARDTAELDDRAPKIMQTLPPLTIITSLASYLDGASMHAWESALTTLYGERRSVDVFWLVSPVFRGRTISVKTLIDRTEEKRQLAALRASEDRYRRVVQDQSEFVVRYGPGGVRTFVNDAYCRYFGPRESLIGTSFLGAVAEEFRDEILAKIEALVPGAEPSVETHRVIRPDGSHGWQEWNDRAVLTDSGELEYQAVGRDVTERVEAQLALRAALEEVQSLRDQLAAENRYLREELRAGQLTTQLVGSSAHLEQLRETIAHVGNTDATVLVLGETGTGKELVANALHEASPRAGRPMVKVNCAAISAGLVEAELFGHTKGAFTGADRARLGRFNVADGGTLFLDEVGELPLETQAKLLRVLQEGTFEAVGSVEEQRADVRIVAATNRDLEAEVEAGRFRADLFYRLNVFPIVLAPLRERPEDIPELAALFLRHYSTRYARAIDGFDDDALALLTGHEWPGNVRELSNVVERAVIVTPSGRISSRSLRFLQTNTERDSGTMPKAQKLEDVQRRHIERVLEQTNGVIAGEAGAARILGLSPSTLRSRMQKLGMRRADIAEADQD